MSQETPPRKPATVQDVAQAAGVSKATAARALGQYGAVSTSVRARVVAAAEALGYRPNEMARSMSTGRSGTIGVIVGDIENPYFGLAVRGISDGARALGFNVILANSAEDSAEERMTVEVLARKQIDGLIVAPAAAGDVVHLRDYARPLVLMDRTVAALAVDTVVMDDASAAAEATSLLLDAGHRRIAYLTATKLAGAHTEIDISTVANRIAGFARAMQAAGIGDPWAQVHFGVTPRGDGQGVIRALLARDDRPTAVLASDSLIALEVLRATKALGLTIPGDLSLVSFHDADWTSAVTPAVTVLAQPAYALGQAAVGMLIERIEGLIAPPRRVELPMRLIVRESVARIDLSASIKP
ncbi:LacI family DNA-binding transcriptional regulator [Acidisoma cellulosilytica]|uniref:LacI family DNA-binding transcriptional regulator n=1 Tax=Acidisoma cellulosilyticum TaxID=2802395 RepID=A0A964E6U8_9PROT|nr:LacI family DNA-binding transcriptional regulator [Acidisoma cellulosilyticum]MCB8883383.1 LacI family DNA-binding transcriptional regulator [Acidisoma cellulosilyticum]